MKNKKLIPPESYVPVLAVIDYSDMEKDLGCFYQAEVVIWNGKDYTFQWDAKTVVKVIRWYPLPRRIKNKIDELFIVNGE